MGAWYIRIIGKQRKVVNLDLLVQAIIALGEQLRVEERQVEQRAMSKSEIEATE